MEMERLVKGGKTEGKVTGPLFPRLHIDDTKKVGPRAPPRNKMAVYEPLSIPSPRFNNSPIPSPRFANSPTSILPPSPVPMLTNMPSSGQGVGIESGMLSAGQKSFVPFHTNERRTSCSNERLSDNMKGNSLKRSMNVQNENVAESKLSTVSSTLFEPSNPSQFRWPCLQNDESELRVPNLVHPQMSMGTNKEKILVSASCSLELQTPSAKKAKIFVPIDLESERHVKISRGDSLAVPEARHGYDKTLINFRNQGQCMDPLAEEEDFDVSDLVPITSNCENKNCKPDQTETIKARGHLGMFRQVNKVCRGVITEELKVSAVNSASVVRSESCHESPKSDSIDRTLNVGKGNQHDENQFSTLVNLENMNEDPSHAPVKDCAVVTPDVVVEMIGKKQFWKARNEIILQQRVFSMQVFELHRIIKVQRMLVGAGNLHQKEPIPLTNALVQPTLVKELLPETIQDASSWQGKSRNEVSKINVVDRPIEKPPRLLLNSNTPSLDTHSEHNFSKPAYSNLPMWCLPTPGNQWLVPVMSPSEGLIYKPYPTPPPPPPPPPAPTPPTFLGTLYSEPEPINTTLRNEEFSKSPVEVHGTAPMDPSNFAPNGMPYISPLASASTFKQMTGLANLNNFYGVQPSSCINGNRNVVEAKEGEKDESTTSCTKKIRVSNDALPLFPTTPTTLDIGQPVQSCNNEQKTKVIKVIPRNPRFASESVASIIKLIQEERKTLCSDKV